MLVELSVMQSKYLTWRLRLVILFTIYISCLTSALERGPVFIVEPPRTVYVESKIGKVVDCSGHGYPEPEVVWKTESGQIIAAESNDLIEVYQNGSLVFHPFERDRYDYSLHSSSYRCYLSNSHGTIISPPVRISTDVNQQMISSRVYDEYAIEGTTAVLKCRILGYSTQGSVVKSWLKNDRVIEFDNPPKNDHGLADPSQNNFRRHSPCSERFKYLRVELTNEESSKFLKTPDGSLHVTNVDRSDPDLTFKCRTLNEVSGTITTSLSGGRIHITEVRSSLPVKITNFLSVVEVKVGDEILVPCAAQGRPPLQFRWRFLNGTGDLPGTVLHSGSLFIDKVTADEEGLYECQVSNSFGSDRKVTKLAIQVDLQAYILPERQVADIGSPLAINCSVSGNPIKKISWFRNGKLLDESARTLVIAETDEDDFGSYQCFVGNDRQMAQASTFISIGNIKPTIIKRFQSSTLSPGANLKLECSAKGKPNPLLNWRLDGQLIKKSKNILIRSFVNTQGLTTSVLEIQNIDSKLGGNYECVASNKAGNASYSSRTDVYGVPFVRPLKDITVAEGSDVFVPCHVTGYPIKSIDWHKDGDRNAKRKLVYASNGTLEIRRVDVAHDEGLYSCVAQNFQGAKHSQDMRIKVLVPPVISPGLSTEEKNVGDTAMLFCVVQRGSQPVDITWLKDNSSITFSQDIVSSKTSHSSVLQIKPIKRIHEGNYTCVATNGAGRDTFIKQIVVKSPPKIVTVESEMSTGIGSNVWLDCETEGNPKSAIEWSMEKGTISQSKKYSIYKNGTLLIRNADRSDEGVYTCKAHNGIKPDSFLDSKLHIGEKPKIFGRKEFDEQSMPKSLICVVRGSKPMKLFWFVNNKKIEPTDRSILTTKTTPTGFETELKKLSKTSSYKCTAENKFGSAFYMFKVGLAGKVQPTIAQPVNSWNSILPSVIWERENLGKAQLNEAPAIYNIRTTQPSAQEKEKAQVRSSINRQETGEKISFLQILIASVTTAVIILLFVLLLVLIVLWKRRADKRERQSIYYEQEMAGKNEVLASEYDSSTIGSRKYGQLRPRSARSCETLTESGYYATIAPYATFNPLESDGRDMGTLPRRISETRNQDF